ncbi:MAG TPA: hypothetical protein VMG59_03355 [Phycisphaerae bacterium]|nr:hypothetical protein [Phycisphaerae bacterium]
MTQSIRSKSVAILTAAAIGGLVAGATVKPAQASSIAGISAHAIATTAPTTEPNSCSSKNGCQGK